MNLKIVSHVVSFVLCYRGTVCPLVMMNMVNIPIANALDGPSVISSEIGVFVVLLVLFQ